MELRQASRRAVAWRGRRALHRSARPEDFALSRSLDRYLLREIAKPFGFFVLVFTGVVWLTQSLRVIDTVVNSGQGPGVFLEFSALLLPFVLGLVLPLAAFGATLLATSRLFAESEVVAMLAAGFSPLALARPVALFGGATAAAAFAMTAWLAPGAAAGMRDRIATIEADVAGALIFEGRFLHPSDGLTLFVRERVGDGTMRGVFVHDARDPDGAVTYTAREAALRDSASGPQLVMREGAAQRLEPADAEALPALSLLRFESLVLDLMQFMESEGARRPKPRERPTLELLHAAAAEPDPEDRARLTAEAHERLSDPLYALGLPLLGLGLLIGGGFSRHGYASRVGAAVAIGAALRLSGVAVKAVVAGDAALWPLIYAPPLIGAAAGLWALSLGGVAPRLQWGRLR